MIERYSLEEMSKIWDLKSKFDYYLKVELAVLDSYAKIGEIPYEIVQEIKSKAKFDIKRIDEIEKEVHHDVIAFLTNVNENVGENSRYIHKGLTSSDVIDTALALQIKDANKIIKKDLEIVINTIKEKIKEHKDTICIGRSHGILAEPMTFGIKLCSWLDFFERNLKRFEISAKEIEIGQISGPVGTYSNISPKIELLTCEQLGLKPAKISTQVIPRDLHAYYMQSLALIAKAIEQCCTEIRHLQKTEILELEEGFAKGQKGSSAMPHKRNPIASENLCGLARLVKTNSFAAMDNIVLWHERDISHSSVERVIFPDNTILIDYMLTRFAKTIKNLSVYKENMSKNLNLYGGIIFSQKILLILTEKGLSREEAYEIVQRNAFSAFNKEQGNFKQNLLNDKQLLQILTEQEIEDCFNPQNFLKNINAIYNRFRV